ncbi:unnamed protein product [Bursaphelenchus xylophilus]|uniref:Inositol-pentakisphosphate 2-kinase n=1 Tax=Bursaphelenchus xylophilus TaxID=6326 RepID=A0A1I7SSE5_BURXY|nr:unnamed protein product [Bursaphelenchus xylophilus]CAG9097653.1 unnamed protein product [Bursaphelenchus xylophilus]
MAASRRYQTVMIIDPWEYRGFCFRGEGRRNLVVSAKHEKEDLRIVWRLTKDKRARIVAFNSNSELLIKYIRSYVLPLVNPHFFNEPRLVNMHFNDLIHISKIPLLPHNQKVDSFSELCDNIRFPLSLFPLDYRSRSEFVLQMPDATRMPKKIFSNLVMYGPTLTVEIKPKQGFYQKHHGVNLPFCNNCILQLEKTQSKEFCRMYDFCPLELYSGEFPRMMDALISLFKNPHRNLRLFRDGDCVYDDQSDFSDLRRLDNQIFPGQNNSINLLLSLLCYALAGVRASDEPFYLHENSILATLLKAQRVDSIGIVKAKEIYDRQPQEVKEQLMDESNLLQKDGAKLFTSNDERSLLERYFVAATMKDCSLMINCRLVRGPTVFTDESPSSRLIRIETNADPLYFAVHVQVVDLDPKLPRNLLNAHQRFMNGVQIINNTPGIHKPCHIH